MKQGIVISTWSGGRECLENLLASIPPRLEYPIFVVVNDSDNAPWIIDLLKTQPKRNITVVLNPVDGYEVGAIKIAVELFDVDEFIFFQDTMEVINPKIFDIFFKKYSGISISYNNHFQMYLGKFKRSVLKQMNFPIVRHKLGAIAQEFYFVKQYADIDPVMIFNPDFHDKEFLGNPDNYDFKFGRENLVLRDQYLIKRKAAFSEEHINKEAEKLGMRWWRKKDEDTIIHTRA